MSSMVGTTQQFEREANWLIAGFLIGLALCAVVLWALL